MAEYKWELPVFSNCVGIWLYQSTFMNLQCNKFMFPHQAGNIDQYTISCIFDLIQLIHVIFSFQVNWAYDKHDKCRQILMIDYKKV